MLPIIWTSATTLACCGLALRATRNFRGTTMVSPATWLFASTLFIGLVELLANLQFHPTWLTPARYIAAMSSFCPCMAVLGAKRPQDRAWQWIVLSLWLVLSLPALQSAIFRPGEPVAPFAAWAWMILALLTLELINYLSSRYRLSALLFLIGQSLLIVPHFTNTTGEPSPSLPGSPGQWTLTLWLIGGLIVVQEAPSKEQARSVSARWDRFRDWYGTFWAFRVLTLVNQTAAVANWPVQLTPGGFVPIERSESKRLTSADNVESPDGDNRLSEEELEKLVTQSLQTTLRRFF